MNSVDFLTGFNSLMGIIPSGAKTVLAIVGVLLVVVALVKYVWDRRKDQGGARLPWMYLILGAILAGPLITIPVILTLLQIIVSLALTVLNFFLGFLK